MTEPEIAETHTATCSCGSFRLKVQGAPDRVYACACLECQRATGSAFAYRALYSRRAVVSDEGDRRRFRRITDAGMWMDQIFCPTCGTIIYMEAEVIEDKLVVSVGCFGEPDFAPPASIFWSRRRHDWYQPVEGITLID